MNQPWSIDRTQHRLLVVNDDPVGRYTTVRLLNAAGFPTEEAANGAQALAVADRDISAVVLDIHLPDIDGFELCRRLRARNTTFRLPVIHLTAAYLTDEDKVRGLDAGADAYLTHPVEPAVLVSTIQALVRTQAAEAAMRASEVKFRTVYAQAPSGICLLDGGAADAALRRPAGPGGGTPVLCAAGQQRPARPVCVDDTVRGSRHGGMDHLPAGGTRRGHGDGDRRVAAAAPDRAAAGDAGPRTHRP
jgi:CheY-like chemotaxis protein